MPRKLSKTPKKTTLAPSGNHAVAQGLQNAKAKPSPEQMKKLKNFIMSLTEAERIEWLKTLSIKELRFFYANPDLFLFDKQIIPEGNWRYCILRCGRRFGKGYAGSAWLAKKIMSGHKKVAICGATYSDVWKLMVPYLCYWFPPGEDDQPVPNTELNTLTFPNGCIVYCHTSDKEIRGYGVSALWCDELASWCGDGTQPDKVKERFNILDTTVSEGNNPQTVVTSTPKPFPLYYEWQAKIDAKDPRYLLITGNMDDNPFLSEAYRQSEREKYGNGRLGKQEYYGDLEGDLEGALWKHEWIDNQRINDINTDDIIRTVVSVDPAGSTNKNSDETGIIVASLVRINCPKCGSWGRNDQCHECRHKRPRVNQMKAVVLEDASGKYSPHEWATKVLEMFNKWNASRVIAEKNMGGATVEYVLRSVAPHLPLKLIHASKAKLTRAEPVSALYEAGKVSHCNFGDIKRFDKLEKQMTTYTGSGSGKDDRMDALCYAIQELILEKTSSVHYLDTRSLPDLR